MEFLRFGSSIPGSYWGCCAADIIQDFNQDPDDKQSIQIVSGDGGGPIVKDREPLFAGMTYGEIFKTRMRIGTFSIREIPNHAFFAILTYSQVNSSIGQKWLKLLKEEGFEFLRSVGNSVYSGAQLGDAPYENRANYIFMLIRNIGTGGMKDTTAPPKAWTDLPEQTKSHLEIWQEGETKLYKQSEIEAAGVPVIYAGLRSKFPQQSKEMREQTIAEIEKKASNKAGSPTSPAADPFATVQVGYEEGAEDCLDCIDDYWPEEADCCDADNPCTC